MASAAASSAAALSRLADRTRVPDPTLQRHAVAAFFRHILSLPAPLPEVAHDAASALLASPHPAVAAHAAASVARLAASRPDLLPPGHALPLLLAPLAASPSPRLASCLVKAVSALAACALRSGSRFPPHDHPFVQALASGADGVRAELARQAARMVAEGLDGIVGFLRPFVMFSVVRKGDAAFARDLVGALAAAAAAAGKAGVAIPVLKLLEESMLHFGRGDDQEMRLWLSSAECLVGAYVVLLRKLVHAQMPTYDAQASSAMLMEALLSQCLFHKKILGTTSTLLGLSKHLFSVQKDLGLCYLAEISGVLSCLSHSLSGLEFEHEQLVGLKLLAFLIEWKHENVLELQEQKHCLSEELLCVMAVINLAISPSKSVKAVVYHILSRFSSLVLDTPATHSSDQQDISTDYHISKPALILPKLLRHIWSQPSSAGFIFMKHTATKVSPESGRNCLEARYWTDQLNDYLTVLRREKLTLDSLSSKKTSSVAISSLISSVACVLVMHPKLGTSAAESLAMLGASDPRLGMPLFVVILFYIKILCDNNNFSTEILLSLIESLPSVAIHGFVLPLALQWISPMLNRDTNLVLYAIAVRLLCKIWIVTDWAFPNLQIVPPTAHLVISSASDFLLKWLFQYEHEHQQWSAALSLGLVFNCFHPTDKKRWFQVINGLLEVISKTESCLAKGSCGLALGYACQGLLTRAHNASGSEVDATTELNERASIEDILHALVSSLIQLCPSSGYSLKKLNIYGTDSMEGMEENSDRCNDDPWAVAGLVLGLGNSVVALYRLGAYGTVTEIKDILMSWIPNVNSSCELFDEMNSVSLCIGSCLALPSVLAFCQRVDLLNEDLDALFNRYTSLASELLNLNKSGIIFQNLLMAVCIGAGSLLSFILDDGVHAMESSAVKKLLDTLRHIYTHPFPPLVHFGGMFGVVNACGAGAGDLTGMSSKLMTSQIKHEESSLVRGPLLASPVGEALSTSMV